MAIAHAQPNDVTTVRPLADKMPASPFNRLIKPPDVEMIRMDLLAGEVHALESMEDPSFLLTIMRLEASQQS